MDLIETLWNVKSNLWEPPLYGSNDLIETLWNVKNHRVGGSGELIFQDLIETLWNVKSDWHLNSIQRCIGFNRDIVECKVHHNKMMPADLCGFNRDIVECKDRFHTVQPHVHSGFNRDIVECKEKSERFLHNI